ncbi:MAG TPA: nickel-dependent hydrogenase large subunit [Methylomusa anaerophila]|uniref:Uptake hydrogenase large subunit n=1 Tax=Methylomusa anaerophila TaxID=1930071 RepID=A0A348ANU7_9FIRM|nr:nickel-dependent hydrogenase large subunit [Methylomusa anaerophila]BBB92745.1 uptake hydrogenase large subunit [Methylomusa anaerophila]HML87402.1 nickel-dependent hydrogenase large subunit [Methylomusa anaerophila]
MKRIVVDPINRIEGHLRVEIKVDEATGKVEDALSSGTAWRGIELIVKGRDPRDAWLFAQRICGVCTTVHALGALRAVEDALNIEIPNNANYIRNIIAATQTVHDHLVHFYHLHALDWVSPVAALKADPAATAALQNTVLEKYRLDMPGPVAYNTDAYPKDFPKATTLYFKEVQNKIQKIVDSGQLGIFAAHYWDHPDYAVLPAEVHLMAVAHYLNMLDKQREIVMPHVVFGGKNPHPHYIVGGMPCAISMNDMNAPVNSERLAIVDNAVNLAINVVNYFYLPDILAIGDLYVKAGYVDGGGLAKERVIGFGEFPEGKYRGTTSGDYHKNLLLRSNGVVENFAQGIAQAVFYPFEPSDLTDPGVLAEGVEHSWYTYPEAGKDLHPWSGVTSPQYTGPKEGTKTEWKYLDEGGKYSWLKTPKWKGKMAEVGPLARYIIIYTKIKKGIITEPTWAEKMIVDQIEAVSKLINLPPEKWLPTTVGRTAARALDAQLNAYINKYFFDKLINNIKAGDTTVANTDKWDPSTWPAESKGVGLHEAPRGALSHWVVIKNGKIENYQAVVPSTWNACPRDSNAGYGAYEASMIDTHVKVAENPLEILRVIHSFDPCLACATHLYNNEGKEIAVVRTDPYL